MDSASPQQPGSSWDDNVGIVTSWYPDLLKRTHAVPPAQFNKVPYVRKNVPGTGLSAHVIDDPSGDEPPKHDTPLDSQPALPAAPLVMFNQQSQTPVRVRESDFRDDFAQNHVLHNLKAFGDKHGEVMVILSRLSFDNYLNQPAYATATAHLPRPSQLNTGNVNYTDGELDFLLIHHQHGILIGELKSIGKPKANKVNIVPTDADIAKRVKLAVKQLDRSAIVVRHLVRDVEPGLAVRKTLFLPYISRDRLKKVLSADKELEHAACNSLGAVNAEEAVLMSCCSDQMSDPDTYRKVSTNVMSQLTDWWQRRMTCTVKTKLSAQHYIDIVARFVGPASTVTVHCNDSPRVEIRTEGQVVAELGRRLTELIILTRKQLDLMIRNPSLACITGPPGTGKTILLVLQGLRWRLQGREVHVVNTRPTSRAVSILIRYQIEALAREDNSSPLQQRGKVIMHHYDFINCAEDVTRAVSELSAAQGCDGRLYLILDEAVFDRSVKEGPLHNDLVTGLVAVVSKLFLWVACVYHNGIPTQLPTEVFTTPLRRAPVVVRELQPALAEMPIHGYSNSDVPAQGDGLSVIELSHHGEGHLGQWPDECELCGYNVATKLFALGVGQKDSNLSYRDVFILTLSSEQQDRLGGNEGSVTSSASGMLSGLRNTSLSVHVLGSKDSSQDKARWEKDVEDMALARTDIIVMAYAGDVAGLVKKIVVILQDRLSGSNDGSSDRDIVAVSRCTTQLIRVTVPPPAVSCPTSIVQPVKEKGDQTSICRDTFGKQLTEPTSGPCFF